jgi:hypothetical protein
MPAPGRSLYLLCVILALYAASTGAMEAGEGSGSAERESAGQVLLSFSISVDGVARSIPIYEGIPVKDIVINFMQENKIDLSHEGTVSMEVRRQLQALGPALSSRVHPSDQIRVVSTAVDVNGAAENVTFVMDGREEIQVLQFCSSRSLGPACVSTILRSLATHDAHEQMLEDAKEVWGGVERPDGKEDRVPQLAILFDVNGQRVALVGYDGQKVQDVVDNFISEHVIPKAFTNEITSHVVDRVLGLGVDDGVVQINFDAEGNPIRLPGPPSEPELLPPVQPNKTEAVEAPPASQSPAETSHDGETETAITREYYIDLYVNQELRPLILRRGEDVKMRAQEWCFQQGTQEPEHIHFVLETILEKMREQDVRDDLSKYEDQLKEVLPGEGELFSFNASSGHAPVSRPSTFVTQRKSASPGLILFRVDYPAGR